MSWIEEAEAFTSLVEREVRVQYPSVLITEPHPGLFGWRYGSNFVQMMVSEPDSTIRLAFAPEAPQYPPQRFPYAITSVTEIANAIIDWLDFRRYRPRGV
jgi:hypothetical protein